jgi:predicted deacetylase
MRAMKLLLSIHDVTPALEDPVRRLWTLCAERGVQPALFVVPNWHGAWPLAEHLSFVRWLRARADDGAEIFLHGERHDEQGLQRGWTDELRAVGRTAGEGEFLTLDHQGALARMERGAALLRRLGLAPIGFVPPAWLAREATARAALDCGLLLGEDVRSVHLHQRATRLPSPVVRWSGRTAIRARLSASVAEVRWMLNKQHWLVRLALHPGDLAHPVTARSLADSLDRWLAVRIPWRYAAL